MNDNEVYKAVADLHNPNPRRKVIHLDSIDGLKMLNNNVLIKINPEVYEKTNSGIIVETAIYEEENNRFKPEHHAVRQGEVIAIPDKFTYHEHGTQGHKTTIEIEIGDIVFFPLVESVNGELIKCQGDYYLVINYETLYLAKRRNVLFYGDGENYIVVDGKLYEVIMLNGYLLCNTLMQEQHEFAVDKQKKNLKLAKVVFSGSPVVYRDTKPMTIYSTKVDCRGYSDGKYVASNPEIKNGDTILISKVVQGAEVMLENEMHLHFDGKNNHRLVQRKYVDSIIKE